MQSRSFTYFVIRISVKTYLFAVEYQYFLDFQNLLLFMIIYFPFKVCSLILPPTWQILDIKTLVPYFFTIFLIRLNAFVCGNEHENKVFFSAFHVINPHPLFLFLEQTLFYQPKRRFLWFLCFHNFLISSNLLWLLTEKEKFSHQKGRELTYHSSHHVFKTPKCIGILKKSFWFLSAECCIAIFLCIVSLTIIV